MVEKRRGINKLKSKIKWFSTEGPSDQQISEAALEMINLKEDDTNIINHI